MNFKTISVLVLCVISAIINAYIQLILPGGIINYGFILISVITMFCALYTNREEEGIAMFFGILAFTASLFNLGLLFYRKEFIYLTAHIRLMYIISTVLIIPAVVLLAVIRREIDKNHPLNNLK